MTESEGDGAASADRAPAPAAPAPPPPFDTTLPLKGGSDGESRSSLSRSARGRGGGARGRGGASDGASVGALSAGALSRSSYGAASHKSRGWTDWDREEGEVHLRQNVERQANHLVDEDAGSVGQLSTGGLSFGLNSTNLSVGEFSSSSSSGADNSSSSSDAIKAPARGLERGPSARTSSAESRFIRPTSGILGQQGLRAKRRGSVSEASCSSMGTVSVESEMSGKGGVRSGPGSVQSMGSLGMRAGREGIHDDGGGGIRVFRRPSLNFDSGFGAAASSSNNDDTAMPRGTASRRAVRRPSLDFNIPGLDLLNKPTPSQPPLAVDDNDSTGRRLAAHASAAGAFAAKKRNNSPAHSVGSHVSHRSGSHASSLSSSLDDKVEQAQRDMVGDRRRIKRRMRFRVARRACAALTAASAVTVGILAAVLPPDRGGPVVGYVKQGSREAVVCVRGWVGSDEIDNELMGTKRSASDPASQTADRTEALVDAAPAVAGRDDALPTGAGPGNRKDLEVRMVGVPYSGDAGGLRNRPQMRGFVAEGIVGGAASSYGGGEEGGMRDLEQLHGMEGAQYPNVLPALHSFNTAERPEDEGIYVPPHLTSNLADVWSLPLRPSDVPLLWSLPRAGSDAVRTVLSTCYGAVEASELGTKGKHGMLLKVSTHPESGVRFVNVDVTDPRGAARAARLDAAGSGLVDVAVARDLHVTSRMFGDVAASRHPSPERVGRGRAFALFRHPVHGAAAAHRDLLRSSEPEKPPRKFDLTLLEYARSDLLEENPVVRALTGEFLDIYKTDGAGPVTSLHVEVAKEVVRRKILVGLSESLDRSVERFELYFRWAGTLPAASTEEGRACRYGAVDKVANEMASQRRVDPESEEYVELARRNWADVQLYHYVRALFEEQGALL